MSAKSSSSKSKRVSATRPARKRLAPELRRTQIVEHAAKLVVVQGYLPLPIEQLARAAGSSKALIYAYFPTQYAIFNALIEREIDVLLAMGFASAASNDDVEQAVLLSAAIYFERIAQVGPLLKILVTDLYMAGHVTSANLERLNHYRENFIKRLKQHLDLTTTELAGSLELLRVIPEEAGNLAYHKQLDTAIARELCNTLMLSSLKALRAPDSVLAILGD